MPRIKNWQDWDEDNERPARNNRSKKPARYDPELESGRIKTSRRPARSELPPPFEPEPPAVTPPAASFPKPPDPPQVTVNRRQMGSLLTPQAAPETKTVQELTPLQLARAYERSGNSPRQIHQLIKSGVPLPRLAGALGMNPEMVRSIYQREEAVRLQRQGLSFAEIGQKLGVSEAEARMTFARGHVQKYGSNPAVQYGRKSGTPFPSGVFEQPTYNRDTNRDSASINSILTDVRKQLEPQGFQLETSFEADPMGGRHVVRVKKDGDYVGQPFRLTATPNGVPLINKTGKSAGGYRLTAQGGGSTLAERLGRAIGQMAANHQVQKSGRASGDAPDMPAWMEEEAPPIWDEAPADLFGDDEGYVPEMPAWMKEGRNEIPTGPSPFGDSQGSPAGDARGKLNVLDLLGMDSKENQNSWRQINAGDYLRMSHAGRFREENAEGIIKNPHGQWDYPPELSQGGYPHTPVVSKGTIYPLEARNFIAGNIELSDGRQWGSQARMGKQMKRDELSLTRKYWQAGPALGVAYPEVPQHIVGQRADRPEMAHIAKAFILDRGGIIPEGQMWKDTNYAPWVFGSFEQNPEKFEIRFDPNYSDEEVLRAAKLLGPDGKFKPRLLKQGDSRVASPNGFKKDMLGNNEAGVINDYEIIETMTDQGNPMKALRLKGYFGNRPNVISAMKLEGWKNLAQDKNIRRDMGLDYDLIMNKPSDTVVANISMLNALPREEFEGLWRDVHGDRPAPTRTSSMEDVEGLAKVWQLYQERNRRTEIIPGRVFDADTRDKYLEAGIIKDGKVEEVAPLFEGAETMYKADLVATGYMAPVRAKYITDVTKLGRGNLSNEILRSVEFNYPGLGEHLRDLGYEGRDIYQTLYEMHRLNSQPGPSTSPSTSSGGASGRGFTEHGSPVVDLLGDLGNKDIRAGIESLYQQRLAEILPASMQGIAEKDYDPDQKKAFRKFQGDASAQAIRAYYDEALGTESYIFKMGSGTATHMVNPGLVERFGFTDEETNEHMSKLRSEGDYQLQRAWSAVNENKVGGFEKWLGKRMQGVIANQEALLSTPSARKRWFGTSDTSIQTHVHASDYALPRNSMAMGWEDIFKLTGLKRTKANRAYLNKLSRAGQLPFSGLRNPASDPIAQTGAILNMVTPDILKAAGLDIPTTGHPVLFHPHQVQRQGGDNDSDMSQVYMVMQKMAGELVNGFGLTPTDPEAITKGARIHAAGEYNDALGKLNVTEAEARRNLLGFDPNADEFSLDGKRLTPAQWQNETLEEYKLNARQIGQAYNIPIRVGINLTTNPEAKKRVSEYGGWMYQNPLDKKNYKPGSPEDDLFHFFTSFNAFTGSFQPSNRQENGRGIYYSYRKNQGFDNLGQYGAAGMLAILKRLTEPREGVKAQMTLDQMAAFMTSSAGNLGHAKDFIDHNWTLPRWEQLESRAIKNLTVTQDQRKILDRFATGDSPMARMMRGYGVRNAIKGAAYIQRKMQSDMLDPAKRAEANTDKFKADLRDYVNVMQNTMFNRGGGVGSDEFKKDYKLFLSELGLDPQSNNFFFLLDPGKSGPAGDFYSWPEEKQRKFYRMAGRLFEKHVTGQGFDQDKKWRSLNPDVPRNNAMFSAWYEDYDRIRDAMAVNARERSEDEIESFVPTLEELGRSQVTGRLVREKHSRKKKILSGLSRLFGQYQQDSGLNGTSQANEDFEAYVAGRKPWTREEQEMLRQAELGHQEAAALREQRRRREGYEEPMYFAEGGVLDRATKLGRSKNGRDIVAGEAGREYVVPEGKTRDLGGGLKVFDKDSLGPGAPEGSEPFFMAKGGLIDYQAYANAPTSDFKTAMLQVAQELTNGNFAGSLDDAKALIGKAIEADIQKMMANPPRNGGKGLYATDITGRATDRMSQALGPNPAAADRAAWDAYLSDYGLSADFQPLTVRSAAVDATTRKQLAASGTSLADFLKGINAQVQGKAFSHANYGHVYEAIPGWSAHWNGNRPGATIPTSPLSAAGAATLARLALPPVAASTAAAGGNNGAAAAPPPGPPFGGFQGSPVGPTTPVTPNQTGPANPPREIVTVPKLTPQMMGEYRHVFDQMKQLQGFNAYDTNPEQLAMLKLAGQRGTDVFKIAQRSKNLTYQSELINLSDLGINPAQQSEYARLIQTYGNGDPDLIDNTRGFTDAEKQDLFNNIYRQHAGDKVTQRAERYLFGRMEELHRNVRERGRSLTDTQMKAWDRYGLDYSSPDPEQLKLAREFNDFFESEFPGMQEHIPQQNQKGEPTYLGGAHPNFDPAFIDTVLPQAKAARLKYESGEKFKNLTPAKVSYMRPDVADVLEQAEGVPFAQEQLKQQQRQQKEAVRMSQIDRKLGDVKDWLKAGRAGTVSAFSLDDQPFYDAAEVSMFSSQRQSAYEAAVPLKEQYDEAMKRGDLGTAQRMWDQIAPLNKTIGELKDNIDTLTPHIKEHIQTLDQQTSVIRDDLKERKGVYSALASKYDELQKERVGLIGTDRTKKDAEISVVKKELDTVHDEIKGQAKELGRISFEKQTLNDLIREPNGRSITGMGSRPKTYGQQAWDELAEGYSPQKLFWEFQNIQQMQFMAFQPMLQMQQQYLGQQAALGQANYALGAGSMPQSVLSAMAAQANMSRAQSAFGQGVDNSITMGLYKKFTSFLGQNEGAGSFLGSIGFDATSALTAAMGLKMVGGPAISALSKLAGGLGVQSAAPYYLPGGGPGLAATSLAALGTGGGLIAGGLGLGLGLGVNELLASQNAGGNLIGLNWGAQPLSKHLTVAAYEAGGYGGDMWGGAFNPANSWVVRGLADQTGLAGYMGWNVWNQEKADAAGQAVGSYTGAVTKPLPVWVTKMEAEVAKQLGVGTDQLPFDRTELAQMVQMAAEDQGLTKQQIESAGGVAEQLAKEIAASYTSGVSLSQSSSLRQKAIDVSGYAPGTEGAKMMNAWVNQGGLFERQQRLQAAAMTQSVADAMDFSPEQRQEMSQKVYDLLSSGMSMDDVGKTMQQRMMSNQFTWSQAAYASGHPEMALMDQDKPWLPKNLTAQWAVQDRRRAEDNARELGGVTMGANGFESPQGGYGSLWQGGRQETEIGWQRQKLDLEKEFWDFRRKSSLDDFAMQQKFFDFNIRQQRQALEWEEKNSRVQTSYYEKQYELNKQIFDLQTEYQRQDFDKQESRLDIRRGWQLEDSAWNRETFNIQAGWQMEDLQRALRYAGSGRERMDIRRQMERASIMNERKETEMDRADSRATTEYDWAKEDLQTNRKRFEEMNELQRQQMELGREYWQQQQSMSEEYRAARRAALEEQIALQTEQNNLTVQQFNDNMALQDKQHALETTINETKQKWAVQDLATARQRAAEDEKMLGLEREMTNASYFYAYYQAMGYDAANKANPILSEMATSAGKLADDMERAAAAAASMSGTDYSIYGPQMNGQQNTTPNSADAMFPGGSAPNYTPAPGGYMNGPMTPAPNSGFARGGYTGDGDPNEVAGLVHRGEYVVPSGGALVVHDGESSAELVALLNETLAVQTAILAQLQEGGGVILLDEERLKKAGFLHQSNFDQVYRR